MNALDTKAQNLHVAILRKLGRSGGSRANGDPKCFKSTRLISGLATSSMRIT